MKKQFLLFFITIPCSFFSQNNSWNIQQCIDFAQKNNITLKQQEITTRINQNNVLQSSASILPTFNGGAQHVYNFGRTIDRYTNTFANTRVLSQNFYLSGNVLLWSGLAQYNAIKANQYQYLGSVESYLQQKNDLALNVATAYINVIFSDEILQISKAQYTITEQQLLQTEKLVEAGRLAKSVVYDLKSQLANESVNVTSSDNNYQIALLNLKQLVNADTINNFSIEKIPVEIENNDITNLSVQTIYDLALKNQHSIKSTDYNILAAEKNLNVAKGRVSPTLSATGTIGTGTSELDKNIDAVNIVGIEQAPYITQSGEMIYAPRTEIITSKKTFADQFSNNVNKSFGFTLTIPILNGLQTHTGIKNAKLNTLNAKYTQELAQQNLYKSVVQAYANAKAALNKFYATKAAVDASEQSFYYAQQKYNSGAISSFDFNTAKNNLQITQSNFVQAKYDYVFKLKVLDYYQGKELKF